MDALLLCFEYVFPNELSEVNKWWKDQGLPKLHASSYGQTLNQCSNSEINDIHKNEKAVIMPQWVTLYSLT